MIHRLTYHDDDMPKGCTCGYDPWRELGTDNSGPDEDTVQVALAQHLLEIYHLAAKLEL